METRKKAVKKALGRKAMKETKGGLQEGPLALKGMVSLQEGPLAIRGKQIRSGKSVIDPSF